MAIVNRGYGLGTYGINVVTGGYGGNMLYYIWREVLRLTSRISRTLSLESIIGPLGDN